MVLIGTKNVFIQQTSISALKENEMAEFSHWPLPPLVQGGSVRNGRFRGCLAREVGHGVGRGVGDLAARECDGRQGGIRGGRWRSGEGSWTKRKGAATSCAGRMGFNLCPVSRSAKWNLFASLCGMTRFCAGRRVD